jgi:predicted TIM-barrel fold metal-dependent hydrolase
MRFDGVDPGFFDGAARLKDMDADGVDAEVVFPTGRTLLYFLSHPDPEFHLAMVQAYNDAMLDFCRADPSRLLPLAAIPRTSVADAVAEMRRAVAAGHRGVHILGYPSNHDRPHPDDDPFWAAAEALGVPVHIHVRLVPAGTPTRAKGKQGGDLAGLATTGLLDMPLHVADLIFAGVCDRFPALRLVAAEAGAGWLPYLLEQMDDRWWRNRNWLPIKLEHEPSFYYRRNWRSAFMIDNYAVRNRHVLGVDNLMWSTDYPHHGCDWPETRRVVDDMFRDVPLEERRKMCALNAAKLYHLS